MEKLIAEYGAIAEYGIPTLCMIVAILLSAFFEEKFKHRNSKKVKGEN